MSQISSKYAIIDRGMIEQLQPMIQRLHQEAAEKVREHAAMARVIRVKAFAMWPSTISR